MLHASANLCRHITFRLFFLYGHKSVASATRLQNHSFAAIYHTKVLALIGSEICCAYNSHIILI